MVDQTKQCCLPKKEATDKTNFFSGLFYGILPHSFCILYILFSVLGITAGSLFLRKLFIIPYFFEFLIFFSFVLATVSAGIYLKRLGSLSFSGVKLKWKYLSILYSTVVMANILLFFIIFPATANVNSSYAMQNSAKEIALIVNIPCSGHAPLIIDELKKIDGVVGEKFSMPNIFNVQYDASKTSPEKILLAEIFNTYKAIKK